MAGWLASSVKPKRKTKSNDIEDDATENSASGWLASQVQGSKPDGDSHSSPSYGAKRKRRGFMSRIADQEGM